MKSLDKKYTCYLHFNPNDPIWKERASCIEPFARSKQSTYPRYKIEIIKIYKRLSGNGLKECKDYIEKYLDGNKLIMNLTKEEIYRIQNIKEDEWGNHFKLEFYFDGIESYRNNLISEILN